MEQLLTILSGIPGSGKSRVAGRIQEATGAIVASTDQFMVNEAGEYEFKLEQMDPAFSACSLKVMENLLEGRSVVVDNTNIGVAEINAWIVIGQGARAKNPELKVELVRVPVDPTVAFLRQQHGAPEETHSRMAKEFESNEQAPHWPYLPWLTIREEAS